MILLRLSSINFIQRSKSIIIRLQNSFSKRIKSWRRCSTKISKLSSKNTLKTWLSWIPSRPKSQTWVYPRPKPKSKTECLFYNRLCFQGHECCGCIISQSDFDSFWSNNKLKNTKSIYLINQLIDSLILNYSSHVHYKFCHRQEDFQSHLPGRLQHRQNKHHWKIRQ